MKKSIILISIVLVVVLALFLVPKSIWYDVRYYLGMLTEDDLKNFPTNEVTDINPATSSAVGQIIKGTNNLAYKFVPSEVTYLDQRNLAITHEGVTEVIIIGGEETNITNQQDLVVLLQGCKTKKVGCDTVVSVQGESGVGYIVASKIFWNAK